MNIDYNYYTPHAIHSILRSRSANWVKKDGNHIMNESVSFDIEVTSIYQNKQKYAFMYVWMLDIFDKTIIGRTWEEFVEVMNAITNYFQLTGIKRRMVCYIHNLAYEFQFIRHWFKWIKVFSLSRRKPLYAVTSTGIEFRCSYKLSGYNLKKVGELVHIPKLTGDFDYTKVRHKLTPLTKDEIKYCIHDVKIVVAYIKQKMKEEGNNISEIPLTKTGYVRRYVRNQTLRGEGRSFYKRAISELTLEPEEYLMAKQAFAGGYTHASALHSGIECSDVVSYDFSSSYPSVLIAEKYPMTKGRKVEHITIEKFEELMEQDNICAIFTIELKDVRQKFPAESYISQSRCTEYEDIVVNNGRIVSANKIVIDITNIDYKIIKKVYKFTPVAIGHMYVYEAYYLPTSFVKCILHFYESKTTLKGIPEKLAEYMCGKENLNSLFGMCVTDIVREIIEYDNQVGWGEQKRGKKTEEEKRREAEEFKIQLYSQLDKENNKKSRFLFYLWGVFCTAYARQNLWTGIFELGSDYVYSDTDSVKILHYKKHSNYFDRYNEEVTKKLERALDYHHIPHEMLRPKNIKGEQKPLGVWEFDGHYERFKAVRAKSYMYYSHGDFGMTIAGLSKYDPLDEDRYDPITNPKGRKTAIDYLKTLGDPIEQFHKDMKIPKEWTGKLTHTYIDEAFSIRVMDYKGNIANVFEYSAVHLEPAEFHLSIVKAYTDYLKGVQRDIYM